jgi:hypothetical protein
MVRIDRLWLALAAISLATSFAALAETPSPGNVCIRTLDIDHTKARDNRTILFYMKDGKVWSTTLTSYCPELSFNGFIYGPTPPDNICGNMQTIRVIRSGALCELGPLVPVTPRSPP